MARILCVDDVEEKAKDVAEYLKTWKDNPYGRPLETVTEPSFSRAVERLLNERYDLVTLDLHGEADPEPNQQLGAADGVETGPAQEGKRVLEKLRKARFVPVIFYTGYAEKIKGLESLVVRVVKKGRNDVTAVREAAQSLFDTGIPSLMRHIEEAQRSYIWDTVDKHAMDFGGEVQSDELLYLLARRVAAGLERESVKTLLKHPQDRARSVEVYIYPPLPGIIKTGCIYRPDENDVYWIVATPSCDFAQKKVDRVLLLGATKLTMHPFFTKWQTLQKWVPGTGPASAEQQKQRDKAYNSLLNLLKNNSSERWRYLPGTFFIPDLIVDMQKLKQLPVEELAGMDPLCTLDSPYVENFLIHVSKYYGRLGTPDLDLEAVFKRLSGL